MLYPAESAISEVTAEQADVMRAAAEVALFALTGVRSLRATRLRYLLKGVERLVEGIS